MRQSKGQYYNFPVSSIAVAYSGQRSMPGRETISLTKRRGGWEGKDRRIVLIYLWKTKLILQGGKERKQGNLLLAGKGTKRANFLVNPCAKRYIDCFILPGETSPQDKPMAALSQCSRGFTALKACRVAQSHRWFRLLGAEVLSFQESLWNEALYCSIEKLWENLLRQS